MSPFCPPDGRLVLTVLLPNPLLPEAMLKVRSVLMSPPPARPAPAMTCVVCEAAPRLNLARATLALPVPPDATGNGLIPEIVPPVMLTLPSFCTAMVPTAVVAPDCSPKLFLAMLAVAPPVPPADMGNGVSSPEIAPPVMLILLAF